MAKCKECRGIGDIFCPVCKGTRKDPRNTEKECGYCNGKGHVTCNFCGGSGVWVNNARRMVFQ